MANNKVHHRTSDRIFEVVILFFLLVFYLTLLSQPINLVTADLGRHLKNGELFFQNWQIPSTNLYSYTYPNFPFVNHHWGSGFLFFAFYKLFGFIGLSLFFIIVSLATFLLFFHVGWKYSGFRTAVLVSVAAIPVLASRTEIRPEFLSYFLAGIFFWLLWNYQNGKISGRWLFILPGLELLWVNLHIYFFLGGAVLLAFMLENIFDWLVRKKKEALVKVKKQGLVMTLLGIAVLINPSGIKGALYPLFIFKEYGYRLFENQTVWFIEKLFPYPPGLYFKILLGILITSWVLVIIKVVKKQREFPVAIFLLSSFFSALACLAIRNFSIFGYFSLAIIALNFQRDGVEKPRNENYYFSTIFLFLLALTIILVINPDFWKQKDFGLGLAKGVEKSANFFLEQKIQGPVFNDYDIGGYLIYYLYPKQKVFVDNRPEVYPTNFFNEEYIPIQDSKEKWKEENKKYGFNAIFFHRNDVTPWAQKFLISRLSDSDWSPVFIDNYAVIFLKRNQTNQPIIRKYEIPKNNFNSQ